MYVCTSVWKYWHVVLSLWIKYNWHDYKKCLGLLFSIFPFVYERSYHITRLCMYVRLYVNIDKYCYYWSSIVDIVIKCLGLLFNVLFNCLLAQLLCNCDMFVRSNERFDTLSSLFDIFMTLLGTLCHFNYLFGCKVVG